MGFVKSLLREAARTVARRYLVPHVTRPVPGTHLLYKLYDSSGTLLYVGISSRGPIRLAEHYRTKVWFPQVARADFRWYDTREEVERAEQLSIQTENPRYNQIFNSGPW